MLEAWREGTADKAHFRQLSGLPGTDHGGGLPIQNLTQAIVATIKQILSAASAVLQDPAKP